MPIFALLSIILIVVIFFTNFSVPKKTILYIIIFFSFLWGFMWNYYKKNIPSISDQLDIKSWSTNINWIISSTSTCVWKCSNNSSSSSFSSWWGGWWGWWGWWK